MGDELLRALLAIEDQVAQIVEAVREARRRLAEQSNDDRGSDDAGRQDGAGRFL